MQRTHHIRRPALIAVAVMAAFIITYFAFAPEPLGPRAGISPTTAALADIRDAETDTRTDGSPTYAGPGTPQSSDNEAIVGTEVDPAGNAIDVAPGASAITAGPDYTPEPGVNHWQRGRQLFWDRDYAAACIELERATRQRPGSYYPHYLLGLCYQRIGDIDRAEREYIAAREIDGEQPEALVNLARLYLEIDLAEDALELTAQATEVTPEYAAGWNVLGRAHLALEERDDAIAAFREACRLDDDNAYAWNNLGYALLLGGDFEQAHEPLEIAVGLADDIAYMHNNLGTVLEQLGRPEEAHAAFVTAAELDPAHVQAAASAERLAAVIETRPATLVAGDEREEEPTAAVTVPIVESPEEVATTAASTLD